MSDTLKKLRVILTQRELRIFSVLLVVIMFMGVFELAGIGAIMPFMQLVSQPDAIAQSPWLMEVYTYFGFESERSFLIAIGFMVLGLLTVANIFTVVTVWLQHKFAWNSAHSIATRLLEKYLGQSYAFFLGENTSQMAKQILSETNELAKGFLLSLAVLISKSFVALVIFALLVAVDPFLAMAMFAVFGSIYAVMYTGLRKYLNRLGQVRLDANEQRFKSANEAFAGIKIVKMSGTEQFFARRFASASASYCKVEPRCEASYVIPVYFVQTLAFGAILVFILYLLSKGQSMQEVLPLLSLYALAGYRLLPALQQVYSALAKIRYQKPIVDTIYNDLMRESVAVPVTEAKHPIRFDRDITLDSITFKYPESDDYALKQLNLHIGKNQSIALVGTTGSGKTTMVDIITGLLLPTAGRVKIDGIPLDATNRRDWQRLIGYVPQEVALYDDTIARNIAFGTADQDIDSAQLEAVCRLANIHDFITTELPDGYQTRVGERGVRLSGGQRQRIGLARALYQKPQVLVLDEATSALDGITEEAVMAGITAAIKDVTTIMIAHRLDTVKACDTIYMLENGRIASQGTYAELIKKNAVFRRMSRIEPRFEFSKA